jgi:hypothetical protein
VSPRLRRPAGFTAPRISEWCTKLKGDGLISLLIAVEGGVVAKVVPVS